MENGPAPRMRRDRTQPHTLEYDTTEQPGTMATPCRIWRWARRAARNGNLYGSTWAGRGISAHILYYTMAHGPVPDGLELDHLCRVTLCVNPEHLEAVTGKVNARRGLNAKLNDSQRATIMEHYADCKSRGTRMQTNALAASLGINRSTIYYLIHGPWPRYATAKNKEAP